MPKNNSVRTSSSARPRNITSRMTQPESMRTKAYRCGVEPVNGYDAWALFSACAAGDVPKVKALLAKDPNLANAQFWYQMPIHMAVREGHAEIVRLLLKKGADPGQSRFTYDSWNKLLAAARDRGYQKVESVLQRAMQQRFNYSPGFSALKETIIARDPRKVAALLRRKPNLASTSDALGNNAIHWSVITRQLPLIDRFFEHGTPIDAQRADGKTPLLLAAHEAYDYWYRGARGRSHPSLRNAWVIVGKLLAKGAPYTISVAAAVGDRERVEALLKRDASLAGRLDSSRVSPLSYAAREGYTHIVELLLDRGADPSRPEDLAPNGRALFEACGGNHFDTAKLLLDRGADPNAGVDSCGCCLTIVKHHHPTTCNPLRALLRKHGAVDPPYAMSGNAMKQAIIRNEPVIRNEEFLAIVLSKKNSSLLDLLLAKDRSVVKRMQVYAGIAYPRSPVAVQKLLDHGLNPNRPDWLSRTYLHACAENGDTACAAVFLKAGANINARDVEFKGTPLAAAIRQAPPCNEANGSKRVARQLRMVRFLLKRGAATNLGGDEPWATPLAWARRRGLTDIQTLLTEHGATG